MMIMIMTVGCEYEQTYLVPRCCCPYGTKRVEGLAAADADAVMFQDCPRSLARE